MRLNNKTYPILPMLENKDLSMMQIDQVFATKFPLAQHQLQLVHLVQLMWNNAGERRYFLSNPFREAVNKAIDKIPTDDLLSMTIEENGIIFSDKGIVIYSLNPSRQKEFYFEAIGFSKQGVLTSYTYVAKDRTIDGVWATIKDGKPYNDILDSGASFCYGIMSVIYFMHNCKIETKCLKPKEKLRIDKDRHYNESQSAITILDCRWFTELISNIPFGVEGHLRWQPCGTGRAQRKLIWIAAYKKHGYHRRADKEIKNVTEA